MFEIGNELFNVSHNDIQQRHDVMSMQGPFVTRVQHCVQRIEVSGGEQRSSCIKEMHAISSTPIRTKNVRRESPLHHPKVAARPSIYSVALSPNVSPVGKSNAYANGYSPPEKEFSNRMDAIVPSDSAHGEERFVRIGMSHHMARNAVGNDLKRNVSRRLPMGTAFQRTEQYVPLEIVSDEDDSVSKTITKRSRSCRRPANAKRKASVHFKTNSYRGLSAKYDSIDSGRGGSAAISSGTRIPFSDDKHSNDCSGPEDQQSDSDSGLSHCTEGPSRSRCHEEERMECLPSFEMEGRNRKQCTESPRFSSKGGKSRRVSRLPQNVNNHQYDYEPLEIASDDEEDNDNSVKRFTKNHARTQQKRREVPRNFAGRVGRKKLVIYSPENSIGMDGKISDVAGCKSLDSKLLRQDENEESLSKTEAIIDSLLKVDEDDYEKENLHMEKKRPYSIHEKQSSNQCYRSDFSDEEEPAIIVRRSKKAEQCSESLAREQLDEGSFRSMGDVSGSEACGDNESNVEVNEDDEGEEYDHELRANRHYNRNWGNMATSGAEELDESFENPENMNVSHFRFQTCRNKMQMSGFVEENSRVRYGESFDSDYQDRYVVRDQCEVGDDEDESRNLSGFLGNQMNHKLQQKHRRLQNKGPDYLDHESQDEMIADISEYTDLEHGRHIQPLIQSRNESYSLQDSFTSSNIVRGKAKKYIKSSNRKNSVISKKDSSRYKGALEKGVKKGVQVKTSSVLTIKRNLSFSRKRGGRVSQKLDGAQTGSSSEDVDGSTGKRHTNAVAVGGKLSINRKRSRKCTDETSVVAVKSGKKFGKDRAKVGSDTKSSETTESDGPLGKKKRGRPKSAKIKAQQQLRENPGPQEESSENLDSGSKRETFTSKSNVSKNSKLGPSETTDFETPPVKGKRRRAQSVKSKDGAGQQKKGQLNSQSESSETPESGSSPKKKKRGRPPLKSKKSSDAQSEIQTDVKSSDATSEQLECGETSSLPKRRKRGCQAKVEKKLPAQKKAVVSSGQNQSKVETPEAENGEAPSNEKKLVKVPRKNSKRQKIDPEAEKLQTNSDGLHVSSSDSESDKSGVSKRRPLFSSEKFTNELLLNQNEISPEVAEKKTDMQPKFSPLRDKKKPAESSSDYLRKKVLTMRLGTSAFLNSVIEENALVVTSTPKKSTTESRSSSSTSREEGHSDEVFQGNEGDSSKVDQQSTSVRLDGDSEKNDKLNKSQIIAEANEPVLLPVHSNDDVLNKKILSIDEPVPDNKIQGSSGESATRNAATEELGKKIGESLPPQSLKVNDRLVGLPLTNTAATESVASSSNKGSTTRGSVPVIIDGSPVELELFADYSKIPFRSRQKESLNAVQYGAALDVLGLGTGYIHLAPGTEKGLQHPKSFNMAFLILDGQVKVKIHESDIVAKPGDFFAVPKGCKYNLTGIGDRNAIVAYFKSKAL